MLTGDFQSLGICFLVVLTFLKFTEYLADSHVLTSIQSRKVVHILTGPIYIALWPLYSNDPAAKYICAIVPLVVTLRFALIGLGILKDPKTVQSMSRTGNPRELLKGPLSYGVIFVLATITGWRTSLSSLFALVLLCVGDGFAEIFGKRFGKGTLGALPYNKDKTIAGSLAFGVLSFVSVEMFLAYFNWQGLISFPAFSDGKRIALVCAVGAIAEGMVDSEWDNIVVYLAGSLASWLLF